MGKKSKKKKNKPPKLSNYEEAFICLETPIRLPRTPSPRSYRQLADHCLENLPLFLEKHDKMRLGVFSIYLELLLNVGGEEHFLEEKDVEFLKNIAKNKNDLAYFRVESLYYLGIKHDMGRNNDVEGMTERFEDIVELCDNASEHEKRQPLVFAPGNVGDRLSLRKSHVEEQLGQNYDKTKNTVFKSRKVVQVATSAECDYCKKTKDELNGGTLFICAKCKFEYYCSKACQRSAWKNGHNRQCREKGEFHVRDQVLVESTTTRTLRLADSTTTCTQRKAIQVQLVECLEGGDSWVVVDLDGKNQRTVPTKEIQRLRPALWHDIEAYRFFHGQEGAARVQDVETQLEQLDVHESSL